VQTDLIAYPDGVNRPINRGPTSEDFDPLALETQVCFALSAAARTVVALYRPVLEPYHLTHPQYLVLLALWEYGDLSMTRLAAIVHLDLGTLSPLVRRLESTGYVHKERSVRDARVVTISLTAEGVELKKDAASIPVKVAARTGMTFDELMEVHRVVSRVVAAGEAAGVI
jgi:DNA-binding MarR family transcriptional regulator